MIEEDTENKDVLTVWEELKVLYPDETLECFSEEWGISKYQVILKIYNYLNFRREYNKRWKAMHTEDGYLKPDTDYPELNMEKICIVCGTPFLIPEFISGTKHRIYCSVKCRTKMGSMLKTQKRRMDNGVSIHLHNKPLHSCVWCGKTFRPTRIDAGFCSSYCRLKAHRANKKRLQDTRSDDPCSGISVSIQENE